MVAWGSSLDSTVVEVVALFEKMEALFSFMSGLVAVLAPLEKREGNLDLPTLPHWLAIGGSFTGASGNEFTKPL